MADSYDSGFWDAYAQLGGGHNANAGMDAVAARAAARARSWEATAKAWRKEAENQARTAAMNHDKCKALAAAWQARLDAVGREVQHCTGMTSGQWETIKGLTQEEANNRFINVLHDYGWPITQNDLDRESPRSC